MKPIKHLLYNVLLFTATVLVNGCSENSSGNNDPAVIKLLSPADKTIVDISSEVFPYRFEWEVEGGSVRLDLKFSASTGFETDKTYVFGVIEESVKPITETEFKAVLASLELDKIKESTVYWTVTVSGNTDAPGQMRTIIIRNNLDDGNDGGDGDEDPDPFPSSRDPLLWPFAVNSIWNMPIGSDAVYVHAQLEQSPAFGPDEDYIVLTPDQPLMPVYKSNAGWSSTMSRCEHTTTLLFEAPIPQDWIVSPSTWDGTTPNAGLAVLMPDGETIRQSQPFAHCMVGGNGTSGSLSQPDHSIYGDGMYGAHGGSGLSAFGGTLRNHELTPSSGPIRHALKINVFAAKNLYYDAETGGYRWPARKADGYAANTTTGYGRQRTAPVVTECRMGALLALPPWVDIDKLYLKTEPAKILAKAFQEYGAYVVDDTYMNSNAIITEWSPSGRFIEIFKENWGFDFATSGYSDWGRDIMKIFDNLHVVDNNLPESIGGGGTPRQPLAPDFK